MRNQKIDVLRGIGILAIVIGHSSYNLNVASFQFPIARFLYLFHLSIFFFIGGFLFKNKYAMQPWNFIGKKTKDLYWPFVKFCIILLCIRPIFMKLGILTQEYTHIQYVQLFCNILLFQCWGEMTSAMWFLPVYFLGSVLFAFVVSWGIKRNSPIISFLTSVLIGGFGIYLIEKSCQFLYRLEIAFAVIPIFWIGYISAKHWSKIDKAINSIWVLPIGIFLSWIVCTQKGEIDLSVGHIMSPYLFYLVSILGIIMCISLANMIIKLKFLKKIFLVLGQYSFEIMALHLTVSKLIDLAYVSLNPVDIQQLTAFPRGPQLLYPFYWFFNCAIPILVIKILTKAKIFLVGADS